VKPGEAGPTARYGPFDHATIIRYAGALGEYNDLHQDVEAARAAGYPDVFAQGMFVGGLVAQTLWNWLGDEGRLRRYRMRVQAPTFRGDALTLTSWIVTAEAGEAELEARVTNHRGVTVLRAWAAISN
jgi:acyl dehydratase